MRILLSVRSNSGVPALQRDKSAISSIVGVGLYSINTVSEVEQSSPKMISALYSPA